MLKDLDFLSGIAHSRERPCENAAFELPPMARKTFSKKMVSQRKYCTPFLLLSCGLAQVPLRYPSCRRSIAPQIGRLGAVIALWRCSAQRHPPLGNPEKAKKRSSCPGFKCSIEKPEGTNSTNLSSDGHRATRAEVPENNKFAKK